MAAIGLLILMASVSLVHAEDSEESFGTSVGFLAKKSGQDNSNDNNDTNVDDFDFDFFDDDDDDDSGSNSSAGWGGDDDDDDVVGDDDGDDASILDFRSNNNDDDVRVHGDGGDDAPFSNVSALGAMSLSSVDSQNSFSSAEAVKFAYLASAAYCPNIETWSCGVSCQPDIRPKTIRVTTGASQAVRSMVGVRSDGSCFVVFRGTSNLLGIRADLRSPLLQQMPGCNHEGAACMVSQSFLSQYYQTAGPIKGALESLQCRWRSIDITGHSLGGAMSVLAAFDLARAGFHLRNIYTFGSPRVGDGTFAAAVRDVVHVPIYRVTRADDPFPLMPLVDMGFVHVGTEVYYASYARYGPRFCHGEDNSCSLSNLARLASNVYNCVSPTRSMWRCGHLMYMHNLKHGLMSSRSCGERYLMEEQEEEDNTKREQDSDNTEGNGNSNGEEEAKNDGFRHSLFFP